jgi:hypothetical protein
LSASVIPPETPLIDGRKTLLLRLPAILARQPAIPSPNHHCRFTRGQGAQVLATSRRLGSTFIRFMVCGMPIERHSCFPLFSICRYRNRGLILAKHARKGRASPLARSAPSRLPATTPGPARSISRAALAMTAWKADVWRGELAPWGQSSAIIHVRRDFIWMPFSRQDRDRLRRYHVQYC